MPRPRKSEAEHRLTGTTPEWTTPGAPMFASSRPKMPKDLSPVAQAEWKRLTRELAKRGTLTRVDSSALEIYARMFARWKKVADDVESRGAVVEVSWMGQDGVERFKTVENPASKIANRLENSLRAMLKEFGSTPASREAAKPAAPATKPAPPEPGTDEWARQELAAGRNPFATAEPEAPESAPVLDDELLNKAMEEL